MEITTSNISEYIKGASDEYYPQDIASALLRSTMDLTDEEFYSIRADLENALYDLMAIAQNEKNSDYHRVFWNVLQLWAADNVE